MTQTWEYTIEEERPDTGNMNETYSRITLKRQLDGRQIILSIPYRELSDEEIRYRVLSEIGKDKKINLIEI